MLFGLDGVEIGLIIVFVCLFGGILSGFPVAFAIGGAGIISFGIIAALDSAGLLIHQAIDQSSAVYRDLVNSGVKADTISIFRYPDLPRVAESVFPQGWEVAMDRNVSFIVNRMNERVLAGQSIETLLAVLMFVLMGITLERSKIANDLLTTMARVFGPLPGGLAVSIVVVGAFLAASTGIVGATVVTMGLLALPTMLRNNYSPEIATGVIAASGTLGQIIPPSIVIVLLGTLAGDLYSAAQEQRAQLAGCTDALSYLGKPAVLSVGTLFQAALLPGILLALLYALYAFVYALLNPEKAPAVPMGASNSEPITRREGFTWFLGVPILMVVGTILLGNVGVVGSQNMTVSSFSDIEQGASLRTNVSEDCKASMIELHGQSKWDTAVAQQQEIDAAGGLSASERLSPEALQEAIDTVARQTPAGDRCHRGGAGAAGRRPADRPAHILGRLCRADGDPLRGPALRLLPRGHQLRQERADPRGVPATGSDRCRAGVDPGRYHQPDTGGGAGGRGGDHAGSLPQADRHRAQPQGDHLVDAGHSGLHPGRRKL